VTGKHGKSGKDGQTGNTGKDGKDGQTGKKGATGNTGSTGLTGEHGKSGKDGYDGQNGEDGATGNTGSTGVTGKHGKSGKDGQTGYTGKDGQTGKKGATGHTGATGMTGETGKSGNDGNTGERGEFGKGTFTLVQHQLNNGAINQIDSSTIIKIGLIDGWNASIYSLEAFIHFNLSFSLGILYPNVAVGLSYFPSLNTTTTNIDFGFHITEDRSICIYENDNLVKVCTGEFTTTTVFSIQYTGLNLCYYIDGFLIYTINKEIVSPLHANFLLYSSGYHIKNILFYPLLIGPTGPQGLQGAKGSRGLQGPTGPQGLQGIKGGRGRDGHGLPSGGLAGQILVKNTEEEYDTKWCFTNQLQIDSVITLEASIEFLISTIKDLECKYNLLSKNQFTKFNSTFLTYSTLLRSYMNLIAVFDCGNSTTEYSYSPVFDCGQGVEQFTDMVVIRIDGGYSKSMNFSIRETSIQYLESIYPEEEQDYILDCGYSSTDYSICPLIDCGNVSD
jgi:hypothetical protein